MLAEKVIALVLRENVAEDVPPPPLLELLELLLLELLDELLLEELLELLLEEVLLMPELVVPVEPPPHPAATIAAEARRIWLAATEKTGRFVLMSCVPER